jgi:hypothetical protein
MDFRFRDLFTAVRTRPEMFGLDGTYTGFVAFLTGFDLGNAGGVLRGFPEWLSVRLGHRTSLGWSALVRRIALDVGESEDLPRELTAEQEQRAVETLFQLLDEFLEERQSPRKFAQMYRKYNAIQGDV